MNKKLIAILTLVMFALTLLPMGAFAATTNSALQVKAVDTTTSEQVGDLRIAETTATVGSIKATDTITFSLLNGAKFASTGTVTAALFDSPATSSVEANSIIGTVTDNSVTINLQAQVGGTGATIIDFLLSSVALDLSSLSSDVVEVEVFSPNGGLTNGKVTVATIASGKTDATVLSTKTFSKGKTNQSAGTIRIVENRAGALAAGKEVRVSIPTADVEFDGSPKVNVVNTATGMTIATTATGAGSNTVTPSIVPPSVSSDGYSEFSFYVRSKSNSVPVQAAPAIFEITNIKVKVDDDAAEGDVQVKIGGDATSQTLLLGTTKTYGYTVTAEDVVEVMAGDDSETLKDVIIKENIAATIIGNGRTLKLELPENVVWVSRPNVVVDKGAGLDLQPATTPISTNGRTVTYEFKSTVGTPGDFSTSAYTYKFEDGKIAVKANAPEGDVVLTVSGSSNVSGEVKVAEIKKPVIVTGSNVDVEIGKQSQAIGDVLIKEVKAGYLKADKTIVIDLGDPAAGTFAATPKVEVVEGDLKIDKLTKTANTLTITLDKISTIPSTIKITGITVDLDRTPAEGDYSMRVYGSAINRVFDKYDPTVAANAKITGPDALNAKVSNGVSFVGMTVVTPAQEGVVKPVVMTVGSTVYTISGVEMTMDVAPYIKDSRTYFPVRHVANAIGITSDNVVWDNAQRTVTIFRGNRIVQVTIGSRTMLVNGVPLTMDVAPEITADRTMLPIRFVAQGLGINVNWDDATRTITLN